MVAPEVYLIKENDREMFFAHRPLAGVVFMLIGMGIVYFFFHARKKRLLARNAEHLCGFGFVAAVQLEHVPGASSSTCQRCLSRLPCPRNIIINNQTFYFFDFLKYLVIADKAGCTVSNC